MKIYNYILEFCNHSTRRVEETHQHTPKAKPIIPEGGLLEYALERVSDHDKADPRLKVLTIKTTQGKYIFNI